MKKTIIFFVLATLCLLSKLSAQPPSPVKGQVVSTGGQPLSGATVTITGTKLSASTDQQGNFSIPAAPAKGILNISYTGYLSATAYFSQENRTLKINIEPKNNSLEDIQINAGYYSVRDKERTGNISKVNAQTIANQPISNPLASLQGRVAGLIITQRNGLPGSDFSVQIRGRSSIQSGTSPLYLIDGVPFPSESLAQSSPIAANSPLNNINPADIESIEILKDADATAIYGSRGANGVILITTKKGSAGNTTAEFNYSSGVGEITRAADLMNTEEYIAMRKEAFANDKTDPTLANAPDLLAWDNNRYTDFRKLLIGGTARTQNASLRLSGGSLTTSYTFGANYYKESTVFPGAKGLNRKDASLNIVHHSADKRFSLNISGAYGINKNSLLASDLTSLMTLSPNAPLLYDSQGRLNWIENGASFPNPLADTIKPNDTQTNRFNGNLVLGYQILPKLEIKVTTGYSNISLNQYSATPIAAQNPAASPTGFNSFGDNRNETWIAEPQINYSLNFKQKGTLSLLLGATWQGTTAKSTLIRGSGYTNDLLLGSIDAAVTRTPTNAFSEYRYQAAFARVNYNLDGKYLLNLTGRRDGSSRFGPGRQFANFGAIGAAWVFSGEDMVRQSLPFLSFGKIRGSYGVTGNDQISNYQYLDSYISTVPYGNQSGLIPNKLFNEDYGWESSTKFEGALELGFLHDRIRLSAGYFRNITSNQLVSYSLPAQTGFPSVLLNLDARVENYGLEFELNTINFRGPSFSWSTSANLTISRNRLLAFPGLASSSYATTYFIGQPLNIIRGYHYTGISQNTGAYQFEDTNGDGLLNVNDYRFIGTKDPRFYGGIQNTFQYKGFSLEVFFQFVKQKGTDMVYGSANLVGNRVNAPRELLDRWSPANPNARYQAFSQANSGPITTARALMPLSDATLVDASFIRLKNTALSYSLPVTFTDKVRLKTIKLYIQAQNLFTITPYRDLDPESQNINTLPPLRVMNLGIQAIL